jgi:hypothetical protein
MIATDYPTSPDSSNLTAADHLQAAGTLLQQQAADLVSGHHARKLQSVAEALRGLALVLNERRSS